MQLQTIKAIAFIAYTIIGFCPCQAQENYVVRITASNCSYSDGSGETNTLTGFILKNQGIMTALHGVCGCKTIAVEDAAGRDLGRMEVSYVDLENDVALLTSSRIDVSSGFELSKVSPNSLGGQNVTMIGYGYGVSKPKTSTNATVRKTPVRKLIDCLGPTHKGPLGERNSPNIWNEVLDIEIPVAPGCSGSPIIYGGKVIGVADGGLDKGSTNYCWAIPVNNINFVSKGSVKPTYSSLAQQNPARIFVLDSNQGGSQGEAYEEIIYPNIDPNCNTTEKTGIPFSITDIGDGKDDVQFLGTIQFKIENNRVMLYYDATMTGTSGNKWQKSHAAFGPYPAYTPPKNEQIIGFYGGNYDNGNSYRYELGQGSDGKFPYTPIGKDETKQITFRGFHKFVGNFYIYHSGNTQGMLYGSFFNNKESHFFGIRVRRYGN